MGKRKQGEQEAMDILKKMGYEFDESYQDNGTENNKPDLIYKDGRFLEVTHTKHCLGRIQKPNFMLVKDDATDEEIKQAVKDEEKHQEDVAAALKRKRECDYEYDIEKNDYTPQAKDQFRKDCCLLNKEFGSTEMDEKGKRSSEFIARSPCFVAGIENITYVIENCKGPKHQGKDIDLFIFVNSDEMKWLFEGIKQKEFLIGYSQLKNAIHESPFKTIFICEWDMWTMQYEIDNPTMIYAEKREDGIVWTWKNMKKH